MSHIKGPSICQKVPRFQPNTSIIRIIVENLKRNGNGLVLIEAESGASETSSGFLQLSTSIAAGLQSNGISAGDLVVFCLKEKTILSYALVMGTIFAGATAVLIPYVYKHKVQDVVLGQEHLVKAVFCDKEFYPTILKGVQLMDPPPFLVASVDLMNPIFASLFQSPDTFTFYEVSDNKKHVPVILFTSGSTEWDGKGVMIYDRSLQYLSMYSTGYQNCKREFDGLVLHGNSAFYGLFSAIIYNHCYVVTRSSNLSDHLKAIEKYKVDRWKNTTNLIPKYLEELRLHNYDLSSLKWMNFGGCHLSPSLLKKLRNMFSQDVNFLIRYGSTETGLIALRERATSNCVENHCFTGPLVPGVELKIVNDKGEVVPIGCQGHIIVKTEGMMAGYWRLTDLNKQMFDNQGFYKTGDLGYLTEEGLLCNMGRKINLINFRGVKFSSVPLEDIFWSHPAVKEVMIVGQPHPEDIQHMTAFIVKDEQSKYSNEDIESFFNEHVGDTMKLRGGVIFLESIPISLGKRSLKSLKICSS